MKILSYIIGGDQLKGENLSDRVQIALFINIYLVSLMWILLTSLVIHNIVRYVIRQKKYQTRVIFFFYIFAISSCLLRIYFCLGAIPVYLNANIIVFLMSPFCTLVIGILQGWTMIELSVFLKQGQLVIECERLFTSLNQSQRQNILSSSMR